MSKGGWRGGPGASESRGEDGREVSEGGRLGQQSIHVALLGQESCDLYLSCFLSQCEGEGEAEYWTLLEIFQKELGGE